jgi:hypothetical protein
MGFVEGWSANGQPKQKRHNYKVTAPIVKQFGPKGCEKAWNLAVIYGGS